MHQTTQTATLISAAVAALASLSSLFVTSFLVARRERRQQVFEVELKRLIDVEELAGRTTEVFCGYSNVDTLNQEASHLLPALDVAAGRLRRYSKVCQSLRDVRNAVGRVLTACRASRDDSSEKKDLEAAFQQLLKACDSVVKTRNA